MMDAAGSRSQTQSRSCRWSLVACHVTCSLTGYHVQGPTPPPRGRGGSVTRCSVSATDLSTDHSHRPQNQSVSVRSADDFHDSSYFGRAKINK